MSKFWKRLLTGLATGGLSEVVRGIKNQYDKAKDSPDSPYSIASEIEAMADASGMSLDEFLQAYPEYYQEYYKAKEYDGEFLSDAMRTAGDTNIVSNAIDLYNDKAKDKVNAYIDNLTGQRDVEENQKNRQFQHDEAEIARAWEAEQAKAAREWDTIGAQMERAVAAGVNPVSIAMQNGGNIGTATTSIPSSPGVPTGSSGLMHNGILDIAGAVFQGIGTLAENRLKQSQADDIVAMRQYNIAEKIANTNHIQRMCKEVDLSNVSQEIQNRWLDRLNQANYDGMLIQQGVSKATIMEKYSVSQLNFAQIADVRQNMELNLRRFNATLPLELQLMESELDFKRMSTKDVYEEICLRHLQAIEQENRNRQSAAEADIAETQAGIAKATYEDAIAAFHNDMIKGAAEAGVAFNDYQYYGITYDSMFEAVSKANKKIYRRRYQKNSQYVMTPDEYTGTLLNIPR